MFKSKKNTKLSNDENYNPTKRNKKRTKHRSRFNDIKNIYMIKKRNIILIILTNIFLFLFLFRYFIFNHKKKKETKNVSHFNLSTKLNSHLTINKTLDYEREAFAIL